MLALTGPPPINIDFTNDAIGGSTSNRFILPFCDINRDAKTRHHRNEQGIHVLLFRPIPDKRRS
jgi:hypothetical protein